MNPGVKMFSYCDFPYCGRLSLREVIYLFAFVRTSLNFLSQLKSQQYNCYIWNAFFFGGVDSLAVCSLGLLVGKAVLPTGRSCVRTQAVTRIFLLYFFLVFCFLSILCSIIRTLSIREHFFVSIKRSSIFALCNSSTALLLLFSDNSILIRRQHVFVLWISILWPFVFKGSNIRVCLCSNFTQLFLSQLKASSIVTRFETSFFGDADSLVVYSHGLLVGKAVLPTGRSCVRTRAVTRIFLLYFFLVFCFLSILCSIIRTLSIREHFFVSIKWSSIFALCIRLRRYNYLTIIHYESWRQNVFILCIFHSVVVYGEIIKS